ncbi:hypothetical protein [Clostridium cuniculi]|uniref:hypothetical protein n=1 Tax=Clostridium cuniculi TaxID=2548455 RepID=UPI001056A9C5|nr:hypothetical protein [Clostridium cuniculi]
MGLNNVKCDDLVVVEFVKEARILKRQFQLMKNNIDQIEIEDLMKILSITEMLEKEIKELKNESEVALSKDGWKVHKYL